MKWVYLVGPSGLNIRVTYGGSVSCEEEDWGGDQPFMWWDQGSVNSSYSSNCLPASANTLGHGVD